MTYKSTIRTDGLTLKQGAIYDYLREQGGFVGATVIGLNVGKKKYTSASAWACETLQRLVGMGKVVTDGRGHYKASDKPDGTCLP